MRLPILYSFRRCPYAMRARWALRYAGVQVELREVELRNKPEALRAISPKATVPVLQLPDGHVIEQSLQIMEWALSQHDPDGWAQVGDAALGGTLIARNDGPFKALLDKYKYPNRQLTAEQAKDKPLVLRSQQQSRAEAVALHLQPLEELLQSQAYLLADRVALCDIALAPFVRQFAAVDAPWFETAALPSLRAWLTRLLAQPHFQQLMASFAPWKPGDPVTVW